MGWIVSGPTNDGEESHSSFFVDSVYTLENQVKLFWQLDDISVYEHEDVAMSAEEKRMILSLEKRKLVEGHYEFDFPLKWQQEGLLDSRSTAEHRMYLLAKRMVKDKDYAARYTQEINKMLERGYAKSGWK